MKKIRIGNDINFRWTVKRGGEAESFEGKTVKVLLRNTYGHRCDIDWHTEPGGIIAGTCYGSTQHYLGAYTLTLVENDGERGMNTVDKIDVWQLVAQQDSSVMEIKNDCVGSSVETVTALIESEIGLGGAAQVTIDVELNEESYNAIANASVTKAFKEVRKDVDSLNSEMKELKPRVDTLEEVKSEAIDLKGIDDAFNESI